MPVQRVVHSDELSPRDRVAATLVIVLRNRSRTSFA